MKEREVYQVSEVLQKINDNVGLVVLLALFPWIGGFVQIFEALRLGFTERVAGQPIATTVIMLAHDFTFVISYDHYYNEIDHWYFKLFWLGMIPANVVEFILLYHWVKYRDRAFAGGLSTAGVVGILAVFQASAFALFWWMQSVVGDPLNLVGFTVVQIGATVFVAPMLLARGTAKGQSRTFMWATLLGPASLGMIFIPYVAPELANNWRFYGVVAATTGCALAALLLFEHYRRTEAATAPGRRAVPAPS